MSLVVVQPHVLKRLWSRGHGDDVADRERGHEGRAAEWQIGRQQKKNCRKHGTYAEYGPARARKAHTKARRGEAMRTWHWTVAKRRSMTWGVVWWRRQSQRSTGGWKHESSKRDTVHPSTHCYLGIEAVARSRRRYPQSQKSHAVVAVDYENRNEQRNSQVERKKQCGMGKKQANGTTPTCGGGGQDGKKECHLPRQGHTTSCPRLCISSADS